MTIPGIAAIAGFGAPSGPVDPYFDNVQLLLHGDGQDNSTTFWDSSKYHYPVSRVNGGILSSTQKKFGPTSMYFDGTGDYLVADNTYPAFNTSDLTIELWFYSTVSTTQCIVDTRTINTNYEPYIHIENGNELRYNIKGGRRFYTSISSNTWYHIALSRNSGVFRAFLNGTQVGTTFNDTTDYLKRSFTIGTFVDQRNTSNSFHFNGYIDEFRLTRGVGRYTSNFSTPTGKYPDR